MYLSFIEGRARGTLWQKASLVLIYSRDLCQGGAALALQVLLNSFLLSEPAPRPPAMSWVKPKCWVSSGRSSGYPGAFAAPLVPGDTQRNSSTLSNLASHSSPRLLWIVLEGTEWAVRLQMTYHFLLDHVGSQHLSCFRHHFQASLHNCRNGRGRCHHPE